MVCKYSSAHADFCGGCLGVGAAKGSAELLVMLSFSLSIIFATNSLPFSLAHILIHYIFFL